MAVVTISRQYGAGGHTLGKMVAEELGYSFVDEEIIQLVAQKAKTSANWIEFVEKEAGGRLLNFIKELVPQSSISLVLDDKLGYLDEEIHVDLIQEIITRIAEEGNAVIIGRGSQYILSDHKDALHVLLVAQRNDRVNFLEKNYDLSPKEAERVVKRQIKRRKHLYKKFGEEDYDHPLIYDLMINTSKQSLEKGLQLIRMLLQDS